jgi:predicted outer membrane repeat protein
VTVSGASTFQVFNVASAVTVSISDLTIANGHTSTLGGGISNAGTLTVTNSTFSGNSAQFGGGIYSEGALTVTNSTFSGNSASGAGGGIEVFGNVTVANSTFSGNSASINGGGIFNGNGVLAVTNSTFTGNSASNLGGGIFHLRGALRVNNSTFSGNSAQFGGGIHNDAGFNVGGIIVTNSTFSGNSASGGGGGIRNNGNATFKNSIIANSPTGGNCAGTVAITAIGVNFSTDNTCGAGFTQVTATQLNLGPLQDNGGPTFTFALLPGSVAIDAVTDCTDLSATPAPVTTDQRGQPRPADGDGNGSALCDAGAFELQPCSITCPANITQATDANQCGASVKYPDPTASGDCFTVTCSPASGSFFPVGTTTVNCDASGTIANPDCLFTITVNDTQPPSITCPTNITQSTDPNQCSAVVSYPAPTVSDNCGVGVPVCSPPSGSTFQKGTTTVTCTVIDSSGNTATCSFTVTINDTQPPSITCPANITQSTDPNLCSAVVSYPAPTVSDNCPGVGVPICSPASGSTFPRGTTTVTCSVSDAASNTSTCSFTITVNDTQPPMITCPANVTAVSAVSCPPSSSTAVTYPPPTVSDNCPGVTVACNPPSGSIFPVGTTTVICTATDASGNTATCSFTVTVFNGRLQDDSNPQNVLVFNTTTGDYRLCCGGTIFTGRGLVVLKGCLFTLQHYPPDRRLLVNLDFSVKRGTASLQFPPGTIKCTIIDRNMADDTSTCP